MYRRGPWSCASFYFILIKRVGKKAHEWTHFLCGRRRYCVYTYVCTYVNQSIIMQLGILGSLFVLGTAVGLCQAVTLDVPLQDGKIVKVEYRLENPEQVLRKQLDKLNPW